MVKSGINVLVMISDGLEINNATVSIIIELNLARTAITYRQFGGIGERTKTMHHSRRGQMIEVLK